MASAIPIGYASPSFNPTNTLKRNVLNYASLGENSNKFYIIELQEGSGDYPYRVYTEYGRMGKPPRQEGRYFRSRWEADNEYDKIVGSKESKGYRKVQVDDGFSSGHITPKVNTKPPKELSNINDKVLQFIGKLYQHSTSFLVKSIQTPLGKLSLGQVSKGYEVLKEIEEALNSGHRHNLEYLSDKFYSIIPVVFGSRVDVQKFLINDFAKLNDKKDLLGVMDSVVKVQESLEKTLEEKYKALGIKLKALSSRSAEYKRLNEMVQKSKGYNHHFGLKVTDILEVEDMIGFDSFNPYNVATKELFHGTRNENILNILQSGLKIKPASAVHTGSMFGSAIYFASSSTKSSNYCWGFNSNGNRNDEFYLFVCEVAVGKIKEYDTAQPHLTKAPRPYNSVLGKKGSSLLHDEYMVYNPNQVKIKYIVGFNRQ